ncbi:MAG: antitoxin VbhA family protein [Oscillospiraceae bacterium]
MAEQTMTLERAMKNAIVSTEMEGFVVTEEQRELMKKVLNNEITLKEAIAVLNKKNK